MFLISVYLIIVLGRAGNVKQSTFRGSATTPNINFCFSWALPLSVGMLEAIFTSPSLH